MNAETSLDAALFTTREMRQDWINRINQYFDGLETKIMDFANGSHVIHSEYTSYSLTILVRN